MRIFSIILVFVLSSQAFAGGATGGTPGKEKLKSRFFDNSIIEYLSDNSGLVSGDTVVAVDEIQPLAKDHLGIDRARLDEIAAKALANYPTHLNGEPLIADHYDFDHEALILRSSSDPERKITIIEFSPE